MPHIHEKEEWDDPKYGIRDNIRYYAKKALGALRGIEYKKSSVILVFNDVGKLALQLRAANDASFPSHWDFSAGGGVDRGEDPKYSAERELGEELGVKASAEFVAEEHYEYPAWTPSVLRKTDTFIYKARHNGPFKPDPKEVEKVQFFELATIDEMMRSGVKFHPEFVLSWDRGIISRAGSY